MSIFINDWEIVSPMGIGKEHFINSLNMMNDGKYQQTNTPLIFDSFNKKTYLGKKGVRNMDDLGAYATIAAKFIVDNNPQLTASKKSDIGVVLGTGTGSIKSHVDYILDIHQQEKIEWIEPIKFPQTVMNCAASQISIWHKFKGVNTTISAGFHSGISAIEYAGNILHQDRVDKVLVGCAEEYSAYSHTLFPANSDWRKNHRLGEGCAMFLVSKKKSAPSDIEIVATKRFAHFNRLTPEQRELSLFNEISDYIDQFGLHASQLQQICFNQYTEQENQIVEGLSERLGVNNTVSILCLNHIMADCLSATVGMQIVILLGNDALSKKLGTWDVSITFDPVGRVAISVLRYGEKL